MKLALSIVGLLASSSLLAQVSVGWDADCDYNVNTDPAALQTALDAGHAEVRLSHASGYAGAIEIAGDVALRGGYADCDAANDDQQSNILSTIDAGGLGQTAVTIAGIEQADVVIEYLAIAGGDGSSDGFPGSGGILVYNTTGEVALHHLDISDNTGGWGGGGLGIGASVEDGELQVTATETVVRNNNATNGGGLYCSSSHASFDIEVWLSAGSVIQGNHAQSHGGGIYTERCQVQFVAGQATHSLGSGIEREIDGNTSNQSGGGLTVFGGARVELLGSGAEAFDLTSNASNLDPDASGQGGAAQVSGGGELELVNARVSHNSSGRYGGGLFADFGGLITLEAAPDGCSYHRFCSQMVGNTLTGTSSGGGGALAARFGGRINLFNTFLTLNNAETQGYIGFAEQSHEGQPARLRLEGNVIAENGNSSDYSNPNAFHARNGSELTVAYNTIRQNKSSSTLLSQLDGSSLSVLGNIIHEFSNLHQAGASAVTAINCNLVRNADSIEVPVTDLIEGTANHLDVASHDYRLAATDALAMDACDGGLYVPQADMGGQPRGQDNPDVVDLNGPFDLGAYEFDAASIDAIFSDAFGS